MTVSAGGSWEMLIGEKDSTELQQILPLSTYGSVLWFYLEAPVLCAWGMQVSGEKANRFGFEGWCLAQGLHGHSGSSRP